MGRDFPLKCELCDDTGELELAARCHPSAPMRVKLDGHLLTLYCYVPECSREIVSFNVVSVHHPDTINKPYDQFH